jgi:DNA repair protein RecN (Recombination protein N)
MLLELTVRDLALIERVRVRLGEGFTVITGETGAGKSLLIDALGLVLGARAETGLVRAGAPSARVEALFERADDPAGDPLICVREVSAAGRSVARVDDETVTAGRLAELVGPLVEIHGQHDQGRLLSAPWQRAVLDAFGGHREAADAVAAAVAAWRDNAAALAALAVDRADLDRRIELQEHAASEIEAAAPRAGEVDELRRALAVAANAEQVARLVDSLRVRFSGEGSGARDVLGRAARDAADLARLDARYAALAQRVEGVAAEADDLAIELGRAAEQDEPLGTVAQMEERLGVLYALFRKYGEGEDTVIAHGEAARAEAERLRGLGSEREARAAANARLEVAARAAAAALTDARRSAAERLRVSVAASLSGLGFGAAAFDVSIGDAPLETSGADTVTFTFAPNPGEPAQPLSRIASGGELSRVALAIKTVLAAADTTPTLVFDEVDAGIGGRSADPVGRSLWRLARRHQVLCITHLPQIAAYADGHFQIAKRTLEGRTVTDVRELTPEERVDELAAMLGGTPGDPATRAAAEELIGRARAARGELSTVR